MLDFLQYAISQSRDDTKTIWRTFGARIAPNFIQVRTCTLSAHTRYPKPGPRSGPAAPVRARMQGSGPDTSSLKRITMTASNQRHGSHHELIFDQDGTYHLQDAE
mgnify:CR=1 FL=1